MLIYELLYWSGLASFVLAFCILGIIGFRYSHWFGPNKSILSELRPIDKKLAKYSVILVILGIIFFIIGALAK